MTKVKILWADDEIDLLKPHIMFLESKGYDLTTVNSGNDAVDEVKENYFDIVFLDENMPGISGLEALQKIKELDHTLPVIMITKSEEESIMEEAIGSQISDYLIKPVNPNQILLSVKKNLDNKRLVSEKTNSSYQQKFRAISMKLMNRLDKDEWKDIHKELIHDKKHNRQPSKKPAQRLQLGKHSPDVQAVDHTQREVDGPISQSFSYNRRFQDFNSARKDKTKRAGMFQIDQNHLIEPDHN